MTQPNTAGAVDLNKHMQDKAVRDAAVDNAAQEAAIRQVAAWDRAMTRAFKGIIPRPVRHRMMLQAAARAERDAA